MARIYNGSWKTGDNTNLSPGHHYQQQYKQGVSALVVPKGEIVTIYKNQDRTGPVSYPFYQGEYQHLYFHGNIPYKPGVIKVEKTDLTVRDMVTVVLLKQYERGKFYQTNQKIPVGQWTAPEHFANNQIDIVYVPYGLCVEVFDDKFKKGSLIFDGIDPKRATKIKLSDYGYGNKISRIQITADTWESAGFHLENETFVEGGEWEAETVHISDISELADVSGMVEITAEVQDTTEIAWDIRAGISAKAEFQFGPEVSQGTVGVEVSVEGGYGENESKTSSRSVTRSFDIETEGVGNVDATLMVRQGVMEADIIRMWRNKRTGATTETRGKIKVEKAGETRISIK